MLLLVNKVLSDLDFEILQIFNTSFSFCLLVYQMNNHLTEKYMPDDQFHCLCSI